MGNLILFLTSSLDCYRKTESGKVATKCNNVNHFVLNFNNIPNKYSTAIVTQYRLGKDSGSAYDIALEMGLEDILSIDEVSDLDKLSTPKFRTFKTPIQNNSFKIESNVDSLEIKYIEIKFES